MAHLLPLTKYVVNGQYVKVQPIATNFAERCICTILTRNLVVEVVALCGIWLGLAATATRKG